MSKKFEKDAKEMMHCTLGLLYLIVGIGGWTYMIFRGQNPGPFPFVLGFGIAKLAWR